MPEPKDPDLLMDVQISQVFSFLEAVGNLLAVIHRDGGHYIAKHGWAKAARDAEGKVHAMRQILAENGLMDKLSP